MSDTSLSAPFLDGLNQGRLRYQACRECGAPQTLTRYACRRCGSARLEWRASEGRGTVYATTIVERAPSDQFRALVPYALALVDLDEGPRLMGHAAPGLTIGDRVAAEFFQSTGHALVRFQPEHAPNRDGPST
jgi:uncharacterized OB-fold protein